MTEELKSNLAAHVFCGFYLGSLGLLQRKKEKLGEQSLTEDEREFLERNKTLIDELQSLQNAKHEDKADAVEMTVPLVPNCHTAPGFEPYFTKPRMTDVHVEIPKDLGVDSWTVTERWRLYHKTEEDMLAFGREHGFPVLFAFYGQRTENKDGVIKVSCEVKLFTKDQMHEAAQFARKQEGELGVFDPKYYRRELEQQPVIEQTFT